MNIEKTKDPNAVEPFQFVWASEDGTNDGTTSDTGYLQGATISSSSTTVESGLTKDSENTLATTIKGVSFGVNTVATVWLSGGTEGETYTVVNRITTSDSRTADQTMFIRITSK